MLYRKVAPNPRRLLLRIVATAGAGALLGVTSCASSEQHGLLPEAPQDAAVDGSSACHPCGSLANPPDDAEADASQVTPMGFVPCPTGVCGSAPYSPDGGDAGAEAGPDAEALDAADDVVHCGGVCGVIVHIDP
jgi:hypothetical protein